MMLSANSSANKRAVGVHVRRSPRAAARQRDSRMGPAAEYGYYLLVGFLPEAALLNFTIRIIYIMAETSHSLLRRPCDILTKLLLYLNNIYEFMSSSERARLNKLDA